MKLFKRRRAVTTTPSSKPPAQPALAATTPALMEQDHVLAGPGGSQAPASSDSSVVQPVSTRRPYRPASTTDTTSTDGIGASGAPPILSYPFAEDGEGHPGDQQYPGLRSTIR
ncbi:unnamed protein product [Prunus armeniaca]